ncbi:MAG: HAMP domain-containing protein [Deltaproteobacteria bacterium]|nr:HAMP domain-containing protein [Deltaproteobacteria bacterium]
MSEYAVPKKPDRPEQKKRRREILISVFIVLLILLFFHFQGQLFKSTLNLPLSNTIVVLAIINLNILLIIVFLFLVCRNLFKLFIEKRRKTPGALLRTKLVAAFVSLSLIPTFLLFFASVAFITNSIENWFNTQIETSLNESLEVAQTYYKNSAANALYYAEQIARTVKDQKLLNQENLPKLHSLVTKKQTEYNLGVVEVFSSTHEELVRAANPHVPMSSFAETDANSIKEGLRGNRFTRITPIGRADLIRGIVPVYSNWNPKDVVGVIVVNYYVPYSLVNKMKEISTSFEQYKETKLLKGKIKQVYIIILLLITLVITFLATWFGLHLAKEITGPIQALAAATDKVATGDLDVTIESTSEDEIGKLVDAFNQMTSDLRRGQVEIGQAYQDLQNINTEIERRRRYMEVVLRNVTAGVVSVDMDGRFTTINKSAEKLLHLQASAVIGQHYTAVMDEQSLAIIGEFLNDLAGSGKDSLRKQILVPIGGNSLTLLIHITTLKDDSGTAIGTVIVFDDLTQLIKAQRMAAWREVARRIAHEIKNPLTPIKLSAQRLRRRYLDRFQEGETVFDECTEMIIKQVDELKVLVNEFSSFARLPSCHPTPDNLNLIIAETIVLYQEGHRNIRFDFHADEALPIFDLDREQIKRALINLLENAVDAVATKEGKITIETSFTKSLQIAAVTISDNGCGIPPEDKNRLFEPYFSTKKSGTGLGLVIVSTIIADHNGYIRVKDNKPTGTSFIIELPVNKRPAPEAATASSFLPEAAEIQD